MVRWSRRALILACAAALLAPPPLSHAGDVGAAMRIADSVYPSVKQRCGTVAIEYGTLSPPNDTNGSIAETSGFECTVRIRPDIVPAYSDAWVCSLLTHEWGHLAGRRFPDNPADPAHSPNPADNMYGPRLVHHPACGEPDDARATRESAAAARLRDAEVHREVLRADLADRLVDLRYALRRAKAAKRRSRGAARERYTRLIKRLRRQVRRLSARYRSLLSPPIAAHPPAAQSPAASMFFVTTSIVRCSSSVGLNSTISVPANSIGVCPGGM